MVKIDFRKKKMALVLLLAPMLANAQDLDLVSPMRNILSQVKEIFPIIAVIIFIIVILMNLGEFTKDGGDWKKGLFKIIIFAVVIGAVTALISNIENISL